MTHGEKAAAYMADAYARVNRGPGICMAQSVGAANLAAGLQDAYLACAPVIAITGRQTQINQQRHAYQEVDHKAPFSAVTKYSINVSELDQLPYFMRQAFRESVSGTPGPVHLDFEGFVGQNIAEAEADLNVIIEEQFTHMPPFRPEPEQGPCKRSHQIAHPGQTTRHHRRRRRHLFRSRCRTCRTRRKIIHSRRHLPQRQRNLPLRPSARHWRLRPILPRLRQQNRL